MGKTVAITKENFHDIVEKNEIVILDFWAEWCGPCKMFAPIFEDASVKHPGIVFGKIDTESEQEIAGLFQIRSIPTLMVIKQGIGIYRQSGALTPPSLAELIEKLGAVDMDDVREKIREAQEEQQNQALSGENEDVDYDFDEDDDEVDYDPDADVDYDPDADVDYDPDADVDYDPDADVDYDPDADVDYDPDYDPDSEE